MPARRLLLLSSSTTFQESRFLWEIVDGFRVGHMAPSKCLNLWVRTGADNLFFYCVVDAWSWCDGSIPKTLEPVREVTSAQLLVVSELETLKSWNFRVSQGH